MKKPSAFKSNAGDSGSLTENSVRENMILGYNSQISIV